MRTYLGCNVYHWGEREQDRLLFECLKPLGEGLLAEGMCQRFFCCRFDVRGPHLKVIFGLAPGKRAEVAARIDDAVAGHLARSPSFAPLSAAEIEARHAACRGKEICSVDHDPTPAPNNS
jgi:hypothetical protein